MASITERASVTAATTHRGRRRIYWLTTGLFALLFLGSFALTIATPAESRRITEFLDYPAWTVFPLAFAKLAGVLTILWGRWTTLTLFAFAGFLYDLVLALGGHIAQQDPQGFLAAAGLLIWTAAFTTDRLGYRHADHP